MKLFPFFHIVALVHQQIGDLLLTILVTYTSTLLSTYRFRSVNCRLLSSVYLEMYMRDINVTYT